MLALSHCVHLLINLFTYLLKISLSAWLNACCYIWLVATVTLPVNDFFSVGIFPKENSGSCLSSVKDNFETSITCTLSVSAFLHYLLYTQNPRIGWCKETSLPSLYTLNGTAAPFARLFTTKPRFSRGLVEWLLGDCWCITQKNKHF